MFTPEEMALNRAEGWDLLGYVGYWRVECINCSENAIDPIIPRFESDIEAFHYCKQRAYEGSERHQRAINAHGSLV